MFYAFMIAKLYDQIYRIIGSKPFKYLKERIVDLKAVFFFTVISKTICLMRPLLVSDGKTIWRGVKGQFKRSIKTTVFGVGLPRSYSLLSPLQDTLLWILYLTCVSPLSRDYPVFLWG